MADAFENILGQPQVREFLRATVALICVNLDSVVLAMTFASVVFPVPGGP